MRVQLIDSYDADAFDDWFDVLRVTDQERWPDIPGWEYGTVKAMADRRNGPEDFLCLAATDASGATVGIGVLQVPNLDNRQLAMLDVRVPPSHRRRHIGSAIVVEAERWAVAAGRDVLRGEAEIPVTSPEADASAPFARQLGFDVVQQANRRHLRLPADRDRIEGLRGEVARAAGEYRLHTFTSPWPQAYVEDQCELQRRMSTDAPTGDAGYEEESWDAGRVKESDELLAAQGLVKLVAVAEHVGSGRLVAFSEIAVTEARRTEGWQWATLVLREHRGHRLGLAVKLANLEYLGATFPTVRLIITGNAQENGPMIAINELLGFEVAAHQDVWQKRVGVRG
jgi:GNAT superfamily N-acetyltransferase